MSPSPENQEDEEEELSDNGSFDEDMEALRRACMLTGRNPDDLVDPSSTATATADSSVPDAEESSSDEDELQVLRKIRCRFSITDSFQPLSMKPLSMLPPVLSDGEEDDFETLRAIQKRFGAYNNDTLDNGKENSSKKEERVHASGVSLEKETSNNLYFDGCKRFPDSEYDCPTSHRLGENLAMQPSASTEWHQSDPCNPSALPPNCSSFPKSAKMFMDAIKKNRSCQRFLRNFQVSCKKRTGRALSQKKDPRVLLISMKKSSASKDSALPDKKISAMYYGPVENCQVANYRMALERFPLALDRKKWSEAEKKNLEKGIRQQFQEMVLQISVDRLSDSGGSYGDLNDLDNLLVSIKDFDITAENIRKFLPKVNWEQLASMYVVGRSGAECEVRWLNFEDPLINCNPWTAEEDKTLLFLVQERGISNWFDIALSLGTNRTPFQCLARYQRSLNVSILKSEWTKDEDAKLRSAVEYFGEGDWQSVASVLEGRTGTQCSNRWKKSLHPTRERIGRWTPDEDKRLTVAQMLFGPKNWKKTAQFVPGRTEVQCRERWVNSLDPSLKWGKWTAEEDSNLRAAIAEHGYCWAKVAECVPRRTDNMCRRRWKVLLPQEVPLLQEARRIQKAALIRNFVDREDERPALGPKDFLPLPMITSEKDVNHTSKQTGKLRGCSNSTKKNNLPSGKVPKKRSKKLRKKPRICPEEALEINNSDGVEAYDGHEPPSKKKTRQHSQKNNFLVPMNGHPPSLPDTIPLMITNGKRMADPDTKRKKRHVKPHSRKKETIEPDENRDGLQLQPENLNLASNNDCTETSSGFNNAAQSQRRRASKKQCKRNICTTKSTEDQNSVKALSSGTEKDANHQQDCSSCPVSTQLTLINENDMVGRNDEDKKMAPNTRSKRRKGMDMDESCSLAPPIRSVEVRMDNGDIIENRSFNTRASKKRSSALKQQHGNNIGTEATSADQEVYVSFKQNGLKKSKRQDVSCSDQHLGTTDGDGITLACFLHRKSEKRKLHVSDCADSACNNPKELESFCDGVDQPHVGNLAVTNVQDDRLTCCDNGVADIFSSCKTSASDLRNNPTIVATENKPCGVNLVREQNDGFHEPVRELASINMEDDHGRECVSLASFMKRKSKRKLQNAKGVAHARVPSNMLKGSKLPPGTVDRFHDVNHMAIMASDNEPGELDLGERLKVHEQEREQVSNGVEGDEDTNDITLASFLQQRKSRKRRLQSD
ncbi:uncharacterized protein LOC107418690 isoform X2 [Ziziphus jujuba]|uniref:Uncharacterized protein LOC107418690 isoform X2 n=1 Tax=Ziziphus jujuba TaxID=326968 RepID=A0ABM3IJD1_ZIZJJ|nr:uncharacterized protein LOC107418690 isoform X2 [Ziziphus jujuba]